MGQTSRQYDKDIQQINFYFPPFYIKSIFTPTLSESKLQQTIINSAIPSSWDLF